MASTLPFLRVGLKCIWDYPRLASLTSLLTLGKIASTLSAKAKSIEGEEPLVGTAPNLLRGLYSLFATLDSHGNSDELVYRQLVTLDIWYTGKQADSIVPGAAPTLPHLARVLVHSRLLIVRTPFRS